MRCRNEKGVFTQSSDQPRHVRSIRLTDSTWLEIGNIAEDFSITRADLIEKLINDHVLRDHETLKQQNEKLKQEIHVLQGKILDMGKSTLLSKGDYQLDIPLGTSPLSSDKLHKIRDRVLGMGILTTGQQSNHYKESRKLLNKFIQVLLKES